MTNHEEKLTLGRPFAGQPVDVQTEHCLNLRHKDAACARCVSACPVQAIELAGVQPNLDDGACVRCGLCLHACPTGVFTQPNPAEVRLAQTFQQLPTHPVALVCALHPTPQTTSAPVAVIVQQRRCLAALAPEQLLALSAHGRRPLWLDDTFCMACPLSQAHVSIAQAVETTNRLLQAFAQPAAIFLHQARIDPGETPNQRPLLDGGNPLVSRRGLWGALWQLAHEQGGPARSPVSTTDREPPKPVNERLPHRVPPARRALQQRLATLNAAQEQSATPALVDVTALPFTNVQVDTQACSACALCARFCPTGALTFSAEAHEFSLHFQAAICIDCGICALACPEDAIMLDNTLPIAAIVGDEEAVLVEGTRIKCRQCGASTAKRLDTPAAALCYACRQGIGVVQPLHDGAGLMADLLSRLPQSTTDQR